MNQNQISRLAQAVANAMNAITEVANAAQDAGINISLEPPSGDVVSVKPLLPPIEYAEDGWSKEPSELGGWRNKLIDDAINKLAFSDHPLADEVIATVKPWFIFHPQMLPIRQRFMPEDLQKRKIALDAANRWFGVRLIFGGGYSGKFEPRDATGFYDPVERFDLDLNEWETGDRHHVMLPGRGFDPVEFAVNKARTIEQSPDRLAEQRRREAEDEADGVVRPKPSPLPPNLP